MKFLIDECLSPALVSIVNQAGFECTCVRDRGLLGAKDSKLMKFLLEEDFTLVTENADDFRALFGTAELHAGLVCLGAPLRPSRTFSTKSRELMTRRSTRRFPVSASSSEREIRGCLPKRAKWGGILGITFYVPTAMS